MPNLMPPQTFLIDPLKSPVGTMLLIHDPEERLRALDFHDFETRMRQLLRLHFGKDRGDFVLKSRETPAALRGIRPGTTLSYGALARKLGRPNSARAVGLANGANPIAIVVPCHRVIGADASLTGYGGGVDRKRWLLAHEGAAFEDLAVGRVSNAA